MLKSISPYFGQLISLFLIFLLVLVIPAFLHEHWDYFRPWFLVWKVKWLVFRNAAENRPETGERIELPPDKFGQVHETLVSGVWVDDRLYYKALGYPMGDRPEGADVEDLHPGIPDLVFGNCERCKRSWKWVHGHTTDYSTGGGLFPLCERCWKELSPAERLPYYRMAWDRWHMTDPAWEQIEKAVLEGK